MSRRGIFGVSQRASAAREPGGSSESNRNSERWRFGAELAKWSPNRTNRNRRRSLSESPAKKRIIMNHQTMTKLGALAVLFVGYLGGCATVPPPAERMASAEASLRSAREVGAERVPQASLHVKLAEEQLQKARELIKNGDNERADLVLQRASADAELGLALARADSTRADAQRAIDQSRALRHESQRPGEQPSSQNGP